MGIDEEQFEWMQFKEGRARFAGNVEGWNGLKHDTFAVEIDGLEYFGQYRSLPPLEDIHVFNFHIATFGYVGMHNVGLPRREINSRAFTQEEAKRIESLIVEFFRVRLEINRRASMLPHRFYVKPTVNVHFDREWVVISEHGLRRLWL